MRMMRIIDIKMRARNVSLNRFNRNSFVGLNLSKLKPKSVGKLLVGWLNGD